MTSNDFTDRDIERLLRGNAPEALRDAASGIDALRALSIAPDETEAARAGAALAAVAAGPAVPLTAPAAAPSRWRIRAAIAGAFALVGAGLLGTAAAADDAAPGDLLYPVDKALEDLGIGDGGTEEACEEAEKLAEEGEVEEAVEHLAEAVEDDEDLDEGSAAALMAAAEKIRENGSEASAEVHERVAAMLEWMATTDATGKEFGQGVSQHARGVWVDPEEGATDEGEGAVSDETAADDETTEKSTGKPETAGNSGKAPGKPETTGKPETAGNSGKSTGKPDTTGKPETTGKP